MITIPIYNGAELMQRWSEAMKIMPREIRAGTGAVPAEKSASEKENVPGLNTDDLFAGRSEVAITHGLETYRLRLTRQNRLILTK